MKKTLSAVAGVAFAAGVASGIAVNPTDALSKGKLLLDPSRTEWRNATVKVIGGIPMVSICVATPYLGADGGLTENKCSKELIASPELVTEVEKTLPAAKKALGLE